MSGVALAVAVVALALSCAAFLQSAGLRRRMARRERAAAEADELLYATWLEEIETLGAQMLARIEEAGQTATETVPPSKSAPRGAVPEAGTASPPEIVGEPEGGVGRAALKGRIRALAREGRSVPDIARRLHVSVGEVEVILDIEERHHI